MLVEITAPDSVHRGRIGWKVPKVEACRYHAATTIAQWDAFIFLAHDEGDEHYGCTHGFNNDEFMEIT